MFSIIILYVIVIQYNINIILYIILENRNRVHPMVAKWQKKN